MHTVSIDTDYIKLQAFLKLSDVISQGSDCKILLAEGSVFVNGILATERGKKLRKGDVVEVYKEKYIVD